ncbi:MAG: DNA (cytosine-5-)-methyltransferase [Clostridia bacterium]|nr:DNA (cytosine-5-)-methyltransferase [Clostridia bacterium]
MKNKIRVASLFSGIGGFELGFKKSKMSYDLVFASEIDKYATMTFSYNFPTKNMRGDITKIDAKDIPDHDLLCGGFPCQSFSVAGKQKGFADETRGTLFFDVIRIVKEKKPKFLFLENVKNLISHDNSETIKTILKHISNCGYTFDITIINSNEAGVPQSRERTYIVGILDYKKEKFEDDKRSPKITTIKKWANKEKLNTMNFFNKINMKKKKYYIKDILENEVDKKYYLTSSKVKKYINEIDKEKMIRKCEDKIIKEFTLPREVHNDLDRQRRVYSIYGISPTLLARSDSPKIIFSKDEDFYIRKLTPLETLRIQGFDEEFTNNVQKNGMSDTQLYKQSGNAVSPPVITEIINNLMEFVNE